MSSAMSNALTEMIMGTKSVGQAFRDMGVAMLTAVVNMIANWIVYGVIMKQLSKIFGIDPKAQAAQQIASNMAIAQSDAGLAAANTLALTSAMYPPPVPEILAGVAYGIGELFAGLTSAPTFYVNGSGDPDRVADKIRKVVTADFRRLAKSKGLR
jgi:hypothetical protein